MANDILYHADSLQITKKDILNSLNDLGINKSDIVMLHSDIGTLGKLGNLSRTALLENITSAFKERIGTDGTLIMPTFTYNFFGPFDVENTKSTVGTLTEHFRKQEGVIRTVHPTHSVAIWGRNQEEFAKISNEAFGQNSIFEKLHKANGKIVFFGVSFEKSCTFMHYIEQLNKVPYRYRRKFKTKIIKYGKMEDCIFYFYYRYFLFQNSFVDFENHLISSGVLKKIKIGFGEISAIDADKLFNEGTLKLNQNIFYLVKSNTLASKIISTASYPFLKFLPWPFVFLNNLGSLIYHYFKIKN